jgi:hypothetical protein
MGELMTRLLALLFLTGCVINNHKIVQHGLKIPDKKIVSLVCDESCTDSERERLPLIEKKLNATLASKCFSDFVMTPNRPWNHLGELKPIDVLDRMLTPQILLVSYFYSPLWQLEGYEVAGQAVVHINRHAVAYQKMSLCTEASLMAHEVSHAKGLNHRGNVHDKFNDLTAPYQINHAFEDRSKDYLNGGCCL